MGKILLFEKNTFFRQLLLQILQYRFPHTAIKGVSSQEECLIEATDFKPDILVLGVNSYAYQEFDLLNHMREKYPGLTIILCTDYDIDEYRKEAILKGASHVISKELWTGKEILALINTLLTNKGNLASPSLEDSFVEEDFLQRPLERRKKAPRGKAGEQEYLFRHPDRRGQQQI